MILVVGSTGLVGTEVCRLLAEQKTPFRALVRSDSNPEKVAHLQSLGADVAVGDLKDPASLAVACAGVEQVISTATCIASVREGDSIETVDHQGQLSLVEAAKQAGVNRFVFISFAHNPDNTYPLSDAKQAVENALASSGMNWSSLQASYFMEMWLSPALGFNYPDRQARIYGDGTNPITWISFRDVAQLAVAALQNDFADNRACAIGGPESLSPNEAIALFEKATNTTFAVENVPVSALQGQKVGATNPFEATFAGLMLQYADGDTIDMTAILKQTGLQLTSVADYATTVNS